MEELKVKVGECKFLGVTVEELSLKPMDLVVGNDICWLEKELV